MSTDLQGLMQLLERAVDAGAATAEVQYVESEGLDVTTVRARPQRKEVASRALRVRTWLADGRYGEATGAPDKHPALTRAALAAAGKAPPQDGAGPAPRLPMVTRGLGIDDRRYPSLTPVDRADVIAAAEKGACGVDRNLQTKDFTYYDRRVRRAVANTNDVIAEEWSTGYHATGTVTHHDVAIREAIASRSFASISSLPFGVVMARRAVALQGSQADPTGVVRVMMPPRVTGTLFARLALAFHSDRIEAGKSLFSATFRKGEPVVDPRIHLIDDAQLPGGFNTWTFDEEGVPPLTLALLREGIPDACYLTIAQTRDSDARPTGHQWEGKIRSGNLMLRSGTRSMSALLSEHSDVRTLMLDHVLGWEDLDLETGDFVVTGSGFVQQGNDQIEGPVRNVVLRGNVLEVLSNLVDIASDTDRIEYVDAPGLLCEGFTIG